jgi:hypothetical protein
MSDEAERSPSAPQSLNTSSGRKRSPTPGSVEQTHIVQTTEECLGADGDLDIPGNSSDDLVAVDSEDDEIQEECEGLGEIVGATAALETEHETLGGRGPMENGEDVISDSDIQEDSEPMNNNYVGSNGYIGQDEEDFGPLDENMQPIH